MSLEGIDQEHVVQVVARGGRSGLEPRLGSGYVVGAGLVLTAAHVVHAADGIVVRRVLGRARDTQADAAVAWICEDPLVDLAVLRLHGQESEAAFRSDAAGPRFGRLEGSSGCAAAGFPLFMLRSGDAGPMAGGRLTYRDTHHAVGVVTSLSGRYGGTLELTVDPPREDPDPRRSPWEGMSGAAVFAGGALVGVVSEHHRAEGANRITARRVESWYDLEPNALAGLSDVLGLPDRDGLAVVGRHGRPDGDGDRTRVFVAYSRKDAVFLKWLASGLRARGCLVDFDQSTEDPSSVATGISVEDDWWKRLEELITAAEVVVFVVSPDSAQSSVCDEEIAFARGLGKRVIPVLWRPIDFAKAPPRLSMLNVKISFATPESEQLEFALGELVTAIRTDVQWFRAAAVLSAAARRWDSAGRSSERLLRGSELNEAEAWAARRPLTAPRHTETLLSFLVDSRTAEDERATVAAIGMARYHELVEVLRPFLEAEIKFRETLPRSGHYGVDKEDELELAYLRSILESRLRWHPKPAVFLSHTGASEGYAEVFRFPCCDCVVWEYRSSGPDEPPTQLRPDGCRDLPASAVPTSRSRMNPFTSRLVSPLLRDQAAVERRKDAGS